MRTNFNIKKYRKGNILYPESSSCLENIKFIVFKTGRAKSIFVDEEDEITLYTLEEKNIDIIGGTCIIEFLEDSEVYLCGLDDLSDVISDKKFSKMLLISIAQKSMLERRIIKNLAFRKCKKRVAYFLLDLAHHNKHEHLILDFDISVQEIANFIGSQRQTVSTIFNELLRKNILMKRSGKHFVISDLEKLKEYAHYDITL